MGLFDFFKKKVKDTPANKEKPRKASHDTFDEIELVEVRSQPVVTGVDSFSEDPICGFDFSRTPYREFDGKLLMLLDGRNYAKFKADLFSLEPFFRQAADYDKDFPLQLRVSFHDIFLPSATINSTPSGRPPKFPIVVSFDVAEPSLEPKDRNAFMAASREAQKAATKKITRPFDSIVGKLSYFPDGSVGKADITFWKGRMGYSVWIRSKDGKLYLSRADRKHVSDDLGVITYRAEA